MCCGKNIFVPRCRNQKETGLEMDGYLHPFPLCNTHISEADRLNCWFILKLCSNKGFLLLCTKHSGLGFFFSILFCNPPAVCWFYCICQLLSIHPNQVAPQHSLLFPFSITHINNFVSVLVPLCFRMNHMNYMHMFVRPVCQNLVTFIKLESYNLHKMHKMLFKHKQSSCKLLWFQCWKDCLRCDCRPHSQKLCSCTSSQPRCEWLIPPRPAPSTCMPNSEYTKLEMWWGHHLARRALNGLMSCWWSFSCSLFVTHPTNRDDRHQDDGGGLRASWYQSHSTVSGQVSLSWRHVEPTPLFLTHPFASLGQN